MSPELLRWLLVGHVYGFMMWTGLLFAQLHILRAHAQANGEAQEAFTTLEKGGAIAMDIGATIALVFGVLLIVLPEGGTALFKGGGFVHAKLTYVAVLVLNHELVRRLIQARMSGKGKAPAAWQFPVCVLSLLGILVMMFVRPF